MGNEKGGCLWEDGVGIYVSFSISCLHCISIGIGAGGMVVVYLLFISVATVSWCYILFRFVWWMGVWVLGFSEKNGKVGLGYLISFWGRKIEK